MSHARIPVVKAVVFDFDGTLTQPGSLDFSTLREALDCPVNLPVLEFIDGLEESKRRRSLEILDDFEFGAAKVSHPNGGAEHLLAYLDSCGIPYGIVSRNSLRSILKSLENFPSVSPTRFRTVISRDDGIAPKPDPASLKVAAQRMGVPVEEILTVGDFVFDVQAGKRSGAVTVYLCNEQPEPSLEESPDYFVKNLEELEHLIERLRELPPGKLPNQFLEESLSTMGEWDEQVLIGPGVGEDAAVIELARDEELIVLKSDPITFTTERLGYYSVVISSNDIVTVGGKPRWLLATLLLPSGTNAAKVQELIREINDFCARYGITLCGGHTEITGAVNQPVVVAQLIGTVARRDLLDKRRLGRGDRILLTKGIALEGTAIIAHEFPQELRSLGLSEEELLSAQRLLTEPGISILKEAQLVSRLDGLIAMHDVTEGGIATALFELSSAGSRKILVDPGKIRVLPETLKICELLGLDPLGLIGSGSLLIACTQAASHKITSKLREGGITVETIGWAEETGRGIELLESGKSWPRFESDEITRALKILSSLPSPNASKDL